MEELDAEAELARILNEELKKVWLETPLGYNEMNDAYHMGEGIMVTKKGWDEYQEAKKDNPDLEPLVHLVEELKKMAKDIDNEV